MSDSLSRYELEVVSPNTQAARRACVKAVSLAREQQSRAGMERVRAASSGESPDSTWNGPHFAEEGGKDANNSTLSSPH